MAAGYLCLVAVLLFAGDLIGMESVVGLNWPDCKISQDAFDPFFLTLTKPNDDQLTGNLASGANVSWPSDEQYDCLRRPWQGFYNASSYPTVIVQPITANDVVFALQYATDHGMRVIPRNGGHSYAGLSVTRGMVIDLSLMDKVEVDRRPQANGDTLVTIGAGQTNIGMYAKLANFNLSLPGGGCPSVGLSGLTLGGGFGSVSRKFGIAAERVESIEVVVFSESLGRYIVVNANATQYEDLFFALRGGMGGNYGIVTKWIYRAFSIHTVYSFGFEGSAKDLDETTRLVAAFVNWTKTDDMDTTTAEIAFNSERCPETNFSQGNCINQQKERKLSLEGICICEDGPIGQKSDGDCTKCKNRVETLRQLLKKTQPGWLSDKILSNSEPGKRVPWYEMIWGIAKCDGIYKSIRNRSGQPGPPTVTDNDIRKCVFHWQEGLGRSKHNRKKSLFLLRDPDKTFFKHVLDYMSDNAEHIVSPNLGTNIEMYQWAGAMTKMPPDSQRAAWAHRDVKWLVHITSAYSADTSTRVISAQQQLLNSLHDRLTQTYRARGQLQDYQNFPDSSLAYNLWTTAYFPKATLDELIATNTKYNPHNLFRTEMSLPVNSKTAAGGQSRQSRQPAGFIVFLVISFQLLLSFF